jgi:hypothetical protein
MPGHLTVLLQAQRMKVFDFSESPLLMSDALEVVTGTYSDRALESMTAVGEYLIDHPRTPWVEGRPDSLHHLFWFDSTQANMEPNHPSSIAYFGCAAVLLSPAESEDSAAVAFFIDVSKRERFPVFSVLCDYFIIRCDGNAPLPLPDLPVPENVKQVFRDWAEKKVNFVLSAPKEALGD